MFDVIRDFLLVPALVTVALLALPAGAVGLVARRLSRGAASAPKGPAAANGWGGWAAAWVLGLLHTLGAILVCFALSVLRGQEAWQLAAWPAAAIGWALIWRTVGRLGLASVWAAVLIATFAWGIDTWLTSTLLFE